MTLTGPDDDPSDPRSHLLREAVRLCLADDGNSTWGFAAAHVKVHDVAAELGIGRTAVYRLWATQDDYRQDLVHYAYERLSPVVLTDDELAMWLADLDDPDVATRRAFGAASTRIWSGGWPVIASALAGYIVAPGFARLDADVRERSLVRTTAQLARVGRMAGRTPVAPLSWREIAEVFDVLIGGVAIASRVAPWLATDRWMIDEHGNPWTMLAAATREAFARLTVEHDADSAPPVDTPRSADVEHLTPPLWTTGQRRALRAGVELLGRNLDVDSISLDAFGAVTVARLARAAGVSRQTVYARWSSDDELRLDVLRRFAALHLRSWRSIDLDPWRVADDWPQTLALAKSFLAFERRVGPRLPWLAFTPYVHDARVADELHRVSRHCIDETAQVLSRHLRHFRLPCSSPLAVEQLAEIGYASWLGVRRRAQVRLAADPSADAWRTELRLTAMLVHVFSAGPAGDDLQRLLDPISRVELDPIRT